MYAEPITNIYILFLKKSCIKEVFFINQSNKFEISICSIWNFQREKEPFLAKFSFWQICQQKLTYLRIVSKNFWSWKKRKRLHIFDCFSRCPKNKETQLLFYIFLRTRVKGNRTRQKERERKREKILIKRRLDDQRRFLKNFLIVQRRKRREERTRGNVYAA